MSLTHSHSSLEDGDPPNGKPSARKSVSIITSTPTTDVGLSTGEKKVDRRAMFHQQTDPKSDSSVSSKNERTVRPVDMIGFKDALKQSASSNLCTRSSMRQGFRNLNKTFSVEDKEKKARDKAIAGWIPVLFLDFLAAFKVFGLYFVTFQSVAASLLNVMLVVYWYNDIQQSGDSKDGKMDRLLLTFAVITPISASIRMAFSRREQALKEIAKFRSFSYYIYLAHISWDWPKRDGGRAAANEEVWIKHGDEVLSHLVHMADEMCRFLLLPTYSRGRHRFTSWGRKEAASMAGVAYCLFDSFNTQRITRICLLTEKLKAYGLTETECSRIHQFERYLSDVCENLRFLKSYRTPEALRTFARLFVFFGPPLYAPSFAQLALNLDSLGIGIVFSVITTVALGALFESNEVLEDPFVGSSILDGIDVNEEFHFLQWQQLVNAREIVFPDAESDISGSRVPALMASMENIRGEVDDSIYDSPV